MADNSGQVANMARVLAIVHIIVGSLLILFGIAELVVGDPGIGYLCYGIWMGVWMCIAGSLGIPGTRKERSTSRNAFAGVFMGFSITSAVFGGMIIITYSIAITYYQDPYNYDENDVRLALSAIILILGIVEFGIGIWAAVCLCMMKPCTCCYGNPPQQGQVIYPLNSGVPVAVPMQAGSGMVPVQAVTPGPQGGQPQMVVVPVSGMVGNQPQFATSGAMATGYQPQFAQAATSGDIATAYQPQVKPTYGQGGYTKFENEEFPVNT